MNRRPLGTLVSAFLCMCMTWATAAGADRDPNPEASADLAARMAAVVEATYAPDQPGASFIVVREGRVLYRGARGMANLELAVPLQPDMIFRLGSITKQFTAAAIMLLVQDGKVALVDPIEKHLPGYPTQGHVITVEHLLNHTSGIQSYTDIPGWFPKQIVHDLPLAELIDGFKKEPMQFAPGERFAYNNSAYVLLGAIIEKASGTTYEGFLQERIFKPLGMDHTCYGSNEPIIRGRVEGYARKEGVPRNAAYLSMTQPHGAGGLVSTVDDLARWDAALYTETPLRSASLRRMWTPATLKNGKPTGYGYGWFIGKLRGREVLEHSGGIPGFITHALRLPESRIYVAVLGNDEGPKADPRTVARRLAAIALGEPAAVAVATNVAPSVLAGHAGVYELNPDLRRTVVAEGNRLFLQSGDGNRREVLPASETEFFFEHDLTRLRFERDDQGRTVAVLIETDEGGEPRRASRVASP